MIYLRLAPPYLFGDAAWLAEARQALFSSSPLYAPEWIGPHLAARPVHFNLPPSAALFAPLAAWQIVWGALMAACLLASIVILWPSLRQPWGLMLAAGLIAAWPVQAALWWANLNSLVLLCLSVAVRWPRLSGWAVGLAIGAKLSPLFLLGWLLRRHGWRAVAQALAVPVTMTAIVVLLTGPQVVSQFIVLRLGERHVLGPFGLDLPMSLSPPLALALAGVAYWRGSLTFGILASIAAVGSIHLHYWIWLLVPLLRALRHRARAEPPAHSTARRSPSASALG